MEATAAAMPDAEMDAVMPAGDPVLVQEGTFVVH